MTPTTAPPLHELSAPTTLAVVAFPPFALLLALKQVQATRSKSDCVQAARSPWRFLAGVLLLLGGFAAAAVIGITVGGDPDRDEATKAGILAGVLALVAALIASVVIASASRTRGFFRRAIRVAALALGVGTLITVVPYAFDEGTRWTLALGMVGVLVTVVADWLADVPPLPPAQPPPLCLACSMPIATSATLPTTRSKRRRVERTLIGVSLVALGWLLGPISAAFAAWE